MRGSGCDKQVQATGEAANAADLALARISASIMNFLHASNGPQTEQEILQAVKGRRASKILALRALVNGGAVKRGGKGGKSDPFRYAAVSPSSVSDEQHIEDGAVPKKTDTDPVPPVTSVTEQAPPGPVTDQQADAAESPSSTAKPFKVYRMPDGRVRELTQEEFDRVVEVFGALFVQDAKVKRKGGAA